MQNPPVTPAKKSNASLWIRNGAIAAVTVCCCIIGLLWFASINSTPTPTSAPAQNTDALQSPGSTAAPAPTIAPTQAPLGQTRDQPHPVSARVDIGGDRELSIVSITRPANDIVESGNMFNATPEPDEEYIIVRLRVVCNKSTNETCSFTTYELKTVGSDGTVRDQAFAAGIPEEMEQGNEFFGGASIEGNLVFLVSQGDGSTVLFYDPLIFGDPIYIALQ
jgi:hypothetical protein